MPAFAHECLGHLLAKDGGIRVAKSRQHPFKGTECCLKVSQLAEPRSCVDERRSYVSANLRLV